MKIVSVVGARPQFVKCAPVSTELRKYHEEVLIHTGQHYDDNMSRVFFEELDIPAPDYNLNAGSGSHARQTASMLTGIEDVLEIEKPDTVLVYGDTNSTVAGALAATKLHIRVAHVEAGLRSFDRSMPEEVNRIIADHVSDLLFCPTSTAVDNLKSEGVTNGVTLAGDVMVDALERAARMKSRNSRLMEELGLNKGEYLVVTVHRAGNTDSPEKLRDIVDALCSLDMPVIFPLHPRTRERLKRYGLAEKASLGMTLVEPLGYADMLTLMKNAYKVATDSGGVQKEAYVLGVPCVTLRENTEWVETLHDGWNELVGTDKEKIVRSIEDSRVTGGRKNIFPGGASRKIAEALSN